MIALQPLSLHPADLAPHPVESAHTLPASWYTDPAFHRFDQSAIFSRNWQFVGRESEVAKVGDQLVAEVAGKPVLVVRGEDGVLRGFFNVCKHRAGPIALRNGNSRNLVCKYHGWTYGLDGGLKRAPEMEGVADFDPCAIHLEPIQVALWESLVFVAMETPAAGLEQVLAGIAQQIAPIRLSEFRFETQVVYDIACNWKVYVDNYLEGYHLPLVHPGLNRLLDYRAYSTHTRDWYSYQHSPLDGDKGPYAGGEAHYYFVYPNLMLNILPNRLQTNRVIALGSERCRVIFDYYYPDRESGEARAMIADDLRFSDEVQQEDIGICEHVQRGLASGAYHAGRLSAKRETGVHHFQNCLRAAYRAALASS